MKKNGTLAQPLINDRIIRFDSFIPCATAFIDARTPGSDKKENFCLIGGGVAENEKQFVHIDIPHGFDVGAGRQPHGCKNSHHSHDTEEVFVVFSGDWKFSWGQEGKSGEVLLSRGDTISLPTQMFRGFENVGDDSGFLFAILGHKKDGSPGRVVWAPYVFHKAKSHGLVLLEDGQLIDTAAGEVLPDGIKEYTPITNEEAESQFRKLTLEQMDQCVARNDEIDTLCQGGISQSPNVDERAIIGCENRFENIGPGKMGGEHGFHLRHITIQPMSEISNHFRHEEEVVIVHEGNLSIEMGGQCSSLKRGDVFTAPIDHPRCYKNNSSEILQMFVIRRGDHPAAAEYL